MAESGVKQVKQILKKCEKDYSDPHLAILEFINTPSKPVGLSPAQRFFDRELRSIHPIKKDLLIPKNAEDVKSRITNSKLKMIQQYNKNVNELPILNVGDRVMIEPYGVHKKWQPGIVTERLPYRRYNITLDSGSEIKRNRRFIRPCNCYIPTKVIKRYDFPEDYQPIDRAIRVHNNMHGNAVDEPVQPEAPIQNIRPQRISRNPDRYGEWKY